jgi:methylenetetrahydrofolate dehydrogenase (NADP+) / methenyltetrahydrofolate cyclohydrolase
MPPNKHNAKRLDGKKLCEEKLLQLKQQISKIKNDQDTPRLAVLQVGDHPASSVYINHKKQASQHIGIHCDWVRIPKTVTTDKLLSIIDTFNKDKSVHGILVQLPLPKNLNPYTILSAVAPHKDVDGLNPLSLGKAITGQSTFQTCVAKGIIDLIQTANISLKGKHAVIVGASPTVGQPIATAFLNQQSTITLCHIATQHLAQHTQQADILVAAIGQTGILTAEHIKPGAIVIDVGIHRLADNRIVGDIPYAQAEAIASWITPVPGGVGPMTVAALMENIYRAYQQQQDHPHE